MSCNDHELVEILSVVPKIGDLGLSLLSRVRPVNTNSVKSVFLAAVRYAMLLSGDQCPLFGNEIRVSAREQIEFMLGEDEDTRVVRIDDEVLCEVKKGVCNMFSMFEVDLSSFVSQCGLNSEACEETGLGTVRGIEWLCSVLPKLNLMREFVLKWVEVSETITSVLEHKKFEYVLWRLKLKVIEVSSKVFDAVGYGTVIVPRGIRVRLLKTWLPFIRKMKLALDSLEGCPYSYRMDEELCESIQGAIVSLIVTLPSNDQADILCGWMGSEEVGFPDLTEVFEIWCFRCKSSKRRVVEGVGIVSNCSVAYDLPA